MLFHWVPVSKQWSTGALVWKNVLIFDLCELFAGLDKQHLKRLVAWPR